MLPNNVSPEMMQMVQQAIMSNPQIASKLQAIMMKPGAQAKMAALMQNPGLMSTPDYANDPDMREMTTIMQQLMGGRLPDVPSAGAASSRPASGKIEHIKTLEQFNTVLNRAGPGKLVVVDFWASWCGPCKRIAPAFAQLAEQKKDVAVFAKVDVDNAKKVAQSKNIKSMPTFHFYKNGRKIDEMKGANEAMLRTKVNAYTRPAAQPKPNPCANYPVQERFSFPKVKINKMAEKLKSVNDELDEKDQGKLGEKQAAGLDTLLKVLEKTSSWHNSKLHRLGTNATITMVKNWSDTNLKFALDLWRIMLLHPDAGPLITENSEVITSVFERVKELEKKDTEGMFTLRGLSNVLSRKTSRKAFLAFMEEEGDDFLLDTLNDLLASTKANTRQAYLKFVMNLCYAFVEQEGTSEDEDFDMARSYIFLALVEQLKAEKEEKVLLNILITIQCVLFKCKSTKEWTGDEGVACDLAETVDKAAASFKSNDGIKLCVTNIKKILKASGSE